MEVDSNCLNFELCQENVDMEPHQIHDVFALVYFDKTVLYLGIISPLFVQDSYHHAGQSF